MRNNWNFSHVVSPKSESFGTVDASTTSATPNAAYTGRAAQLADMKKRQDMEAKSTGDGGTLRIWR